MTRLLLIEDEPDVAEAISTLFANTFQVQVSATLVVALEMLRHATFDVIIADLLLPDASGVEAVVAIKTATPLTPIIAISGDVNLLTPAVEAGASATAAKPFQGPALRELVMLVLSRKANVALHQKAMDQIEEAQKLVEERDAKKDIGRIIKPKPNGEPAGAQ